MKYLEHLLSLLVVFLLLVATAVWTGSLFGQKIGGEEQTAVTNLVTAPTDVTLEALNLSPKTVSLAPLDSAAWQVSDAAGRLLGTIVSTAPYAPKAQGFAGPTPLYIYLNAEGRIQEIAAADNAETPDFFERAFSGTMAHWKGLTAEAGADLKVDGVSGATYSSIALVENMHAALAIRANATHETAMQQPAIGWPATAAVIAVLLLGIVAAWRYRGVKPLRIVVLLFNVGVLGFWTGQFLSLSLLRGWISNGLDPVLYLPTVLMLLVAIVMPWLGRKRHYCTWVCPFGSLQELAYRLPLPKIKVSPKAFKVMTKIRVGVLAVLLVLLYLGIGSSLLDYEPFTAFLVTNAAPAVIALAATFIVAGLFVPNPWCKCCCPVGSLLDLSEESAPANAKQPLQKKNPQ